MDNFKNSSMILHELSQKYNKKLEIKFEKENDDTKCIIIFGEKTYSLVGDVSPTGINKKQLKENTCKNFINILNNELLIDEMDEMEPLYQKIIFELRNEIILLKEEILIIKNQINKK